MNNLWKENIRFSPGSSTLLLSPVTLSRVRSAGWAPALTAALGNMSSPQLCLSYESATNVQWFGETRKWHCLKATI